MHCGNISDRSLGPDGHYPPPGGFESVGIQSPYPTSFYPLEGTEGPDWRLDIHVPQVMAPPLPAFTPPVWGGGMSYPPLHPPAFIPTINQVPRAVRGNYTGMMGDWPPASPHLSSWHTPHRTREHRRNYAYRHERRIPGSYSAVLVLAILTCLTGNLLCALPAVILGAMAVSKHGSDRKSARSLCIGSLGCAITALAVAGIVILMVELYVEF